MASVSVIVMAANESVINTMAASAYQLIMASMAAIMKYQ
jgi:hypothetical protein